MEISSRGLRIRIFLTPFEEALGEEDHVVRATWEGSNPSLRTCSGDLMEDRSPGSDNQKTSIFELIFSSVRL
jgi:hypothetical protein